jgi:hypothetical protein
LREQAWDIYKADMARAGAEAEARSAASGFNYDPKIYQADMERIVAERARREHASYAGVTEQIAAARREVALPKEMNTPKPVIAGLKGKKMALSDYWEAAKAAASSKDMRQAVVAFKHDLEVTRQTRRAAEVQVNRWEAAADNRKAEPIAADRLQAWAEKNAERQADRIDYSAAGLFGMQEQIAAARREVALLKEIDAPAKPRDRGIER